MRLRRMARASHGISVRDGKRENAKASENRGFSLRVFRGARVASVSTNDDSDIDTLVERALAMADAEPTSS